MRGIRLSSLSAMYARGREQVRDTDTSSFASNLLLFLTFDFYALLIYNWIILISISRNVGFSLAR